MKFISNVLYNLLALQDKFLRFRLARTLGAKQNSKRKNFYSNGCFLNLNSIAEEERQKFEFELTALLEKYEYNPEKLLDYIKKSGTEVYYVKNAAKYLNPIGENEGFICPAKSFRALYISTFTKRKLSMNTPEMFILSKGEINKYYFIYHIYNWFAFKHNIEGLDGKSQLLLKKYLYSDENVSELQLDEIYQLKSAIKQDKLAIEFVVKLCRNYDGSKQALDKIKSSNGANL